MRPDNDRWVEVTPTRFAHERAGLEYVRAALPDAEPYRAWSNLEIITDRGRSLEVDLLVIGPAGLYLVELKAWGGRIGGDRYIWTMRGDRVITENNPWRLANEKARVLKSLLTEELRHATRNSRSRPNPREVIPWVQAAVFLHNPDVRCELAPEDRTFLYGIDGKTDRTGLPGIVTGLLTQPARDPDRTVTARRSAVLAALLSRSGIGRRQRRTVGPYELADRVYADGPGWQDFLATHRRYADDRVRVRIYYSGRATTTEERATLERAAEREYRLLRHLEHPGLVAPTMQLDTEMGPALVYPYDENAQRLDHLLAANPQGLPLDRQLAIIRGLAETLRYAHGRHITHRGLSPRSVLVTLDHSDAPQVQVADWQTGARSETTSGTAAASGTVLAGTLHVEALLDPTMHVYQAPETSARVAADEVRLDVFSLGALSYLVLTSHPSAADATELRQRLHDEGGLDLTGHLDGAPDGLRSLILDATQGDVAARLPDVDSFLSRLADAERELVEPEPPEDLDPLEAPPGTVLGDRWRLVRRLGGGSTAVALLVEDLHDGGAGRVLKVARDEERAGRLRDEAEVLRSLDDPRVARLVEDEPVRLAGRTALLLDYAGERTLAGLLREHGRLSLDRLERFGEDLLGVVAYLDGVGVDHRDIKPDNLGVRTRAGDRQKHLVLFDFSLSRARAADVSAGTPPYLDPFLGQGTRRRWDGPAERYAVAVTLFEMATGRTPVYGDGLSDPAVVEAEATIEPGMFDAAVAESLVAFFTRALRRDARARFDTVEEMLHDWRAAFRRVGEAAGAAAGDADALASAATLATPLTQAGLSARALSALEPLGVATVADVLGVKAGQLSRLAGANEATRREIRARAKQWRQRFGQVDMTPPPPPGRPPVMVRGIDAVVEQLIPGSNGRNATEIRAARLLLGRPADDDPGGPLPLPWLTQGQLAELLGVTPARGQQLNAALRRRWSRDGRTNPLGSVRDELVAFIRAQGGIATAMQAAQALLAWRGSVADEPFRSRQALGLVRAAVEAELERGGDARLDRRRRGDMVLLAIEPASGESAPTAAQCIDYAAALGRAAMMLIEVEGGPVPPARALERLRTVPRPEGMPPLDDSRIVRLAAAASGVAAVSSRDELYPESMPAEIALRHSGGAFSVTAGIVTVEALRERVRARFPDAASLPNPPALDGLLARINSPLEWDEAAGGYTVPPPVTATHLTTRSRTPITASEDMEGLVEEVDRRLRDALHQRAFLVIGVDPREVDRAPGLLAARYGVQVVDVTAVLLGHMRQLAAENGIPWDTVLAADAAEPASYDGQGLRGLIASSVSAIDETLASPGGPLLLTEAAPLARYGHMDLLARLADHTTDRPASVWLLAPAGGLTPAPVLDREPIPVFSAAQWLKIPADWFHVRSAPVPGGAR